LTSFHPCATIIIPKEEGTIFDNIPTRKDGNAIISEFQGPDLEGMGYLKEDLLALLQLDKFERMLGLIKENTNKDIDIYSIPLNEGDVIDYTFQFSTDVSQAGPVTTVFAIRITDGTTTLYLQTDGTWNTTIGYSYITPSSSNTNQWQNVDIKSSRVPFDCIMNIFLAEATASTTDETRYKDLRLSLTYFVAGQGQINGHSHTASQSRKLNNINDNEIFIDNTERSSISGTLFLTSQTGILQDKCTTWEFGSGYNTGIPAIVYDNLGQQITETYMFQRYIPRTKFNGNLLSIRNDNGILSNLDIFTNGFTGSQLNNKMLLGSVAIDYKNNSAEFTMWEVFNKTQAEPADNFADFQAYLFNILYQFNYLYENN